MTKYAGILCGLLIGAGSARGAPDIADYRVFEPGPCIERDEHLHPLWREALDALASRRYGDAAHLLSSALTACPDDPMVRHQAALAAWGIGERAVAARWLVMAARNTNAPVATSAAIAALNADAVTESVAIGWLRRGLASANVEERAFWVTRASFNPLWARGSSAWLDLMRELGVPTDRDVARAMGRRLYREWVTTRPVEPDPPMLRLSPFDPGLDSFDKSQQMREELTQRLIGRIRPPSDHVKELEAISADEAPETDLFLEQP